MKHLVKESKSPKTERQLKVQYLNRSLRYRNKMEYSSKQVPSIKLNGNWLEAAGFKIGSQVKVEVSAGQLVIRLIEEETTSRA